MSNPNRRNPTGKTTSVGHGRGRSRGRIQDVATASSNDSKVHVTSSETKSVSQNPVQIQDPASLNIEGLTVSPKRAWGQGYNPLTKGSPMAEGQTEKDFPLMGGGRPAGPGQVEEVDFTVVASKGRGRGQKPSTVQRPKATSEIQKQTVVHDTSQTAATVQRSPESTFENRRQPVVQDTSPATPKADCLQQQKRETEMTRSREPTRPADVTNQGRGQRRQSPRRVTQITNRGRSSYYYTDETRGRFDAAKLGNKLIPLRKDLDSSEVGKKGQPILLQLTHLGLNIKKSNMVAIHYDVSFKPDKPKRLYRSLMALVQMKSYPKNFPAFDGRKNLYSADYLPFGQVITTTVDVFDDEKAANQEYEITIKFAAKVDMSLLIQYMNRGTSMCLPQEALQTIDIVLRNPASKQFVSVGRSFFTPPEGTIVDLGDGLELWYGFYQSAILGWKPFVNVDVAHKGFPRDETLIQVICRICKYKDTELLSKNCELSQNEVFALERYIKGLKVEIQIPNQPAPKRTYKVIKVLKSSHNERFTLEREDSKISLSVSEYYLRFRNYKLKYPNLPCVHTGSPARNVFIPVELCKVARGQTTTRKLNEAQKATMVRNAAQPANIRKKRILDVMKIANFNNDPCVKEFGITVDDRFTEVTGRVLSPPTIMYNSNLKVIPNKGVWKAEKLQVGQTIEKWAVLNCDSRIRNDCIMNFAKEMTKFGKLLGLSIPPYPNVKYIQKRIVEKAEICTELENCKRYGMQLVVAIIPDFGDVYALVKQVAELTVGILTQCIKGKTISKLNSSTVSNILLKVNSKMNGVNHSITNSTIVVLKRPAMIVGADVTHPSPEEQSIPSVAAVAASFDARACRYHMLWRLQPPRTEIIMDLENVMKEQLMFFYVSTNHYKPECIFFYRDGVSEGQFAQVMNQELTAIHRACKALQGDYKPKITFLVVQKRHHTRFFPSRKEDEDGKNGNVPAGTIVDTTITHPTEFDFYLVSHASIQGTSRPTKYHKLWDDNEMNEDDLEELTYYLCHLFSNCTRTVSYPAPTYYAHLAAFRARIYFKGTRINLKNLDFEFSQRQIQSDVCEKTPMFFV